jgi:hypothetical protein
LHHYFHQLLLVDYSKNRRYRNYAVCLDPRQELAIATAQLACYCMYKMWTLTKKLETALGPDTGDYANGVHSEPVRGDVLIGAKV